MRRTCILLLTVLLGLPGGCALAGGKDSSGLPLEEIATIAERESFFADGSACLGERLSDIGSAEELKAFLRKMDPYAKYATPEELEDMRRLSGDLPAGVGMDVFRDRQERLRCSPFQDSPAENAGIRYADELQAVDGVPVYGLPMPEIARRIRGEVGTEVVLRVKGWTGPPMNFAVLRRAGGSPSAVLVRDGRRATVRLFRFGPQTERELRDCLRRIPEDEAVTLDLRGNTGGNLASGIACAKLFLPRGGVAARIRLKDGVRVERTLKDGPWAGRPIVVLQDRYTASSAEMFIAALAESGRAKVFGERTAGKACVQNLFPLSGGGMLKLTTEMLLHPSREGDWEGRGLDPNSPR